MDSFEIFCSSVSTAICSSSSLAMLSLLLLLLLHVVTAMGAEQQNLFTSKHNLFNISKQDPFALKANPLLPDSDAGHSYLLRLLLPTHVIDDADSSRYDVTSRDATDVTSRDVITLKDGGNSTGTKRRHVDRDQRSLSDFGRRLFSASSRRTSRSDRDAPHCRTVCELCERVVRRAASSLCWKECRHHGYHFQVCLAVRTLWEDNPDDVIFLRPH